MMMHNMREHGKMHWGCCWRPMIGKALWWAGLLSFLGGFAAFWQGGYFWNVAAQTWYWTGLVAGVLAIGCRKGGCHHGYCGTCGTKEGG